MHIFAVVDYVTCGMDTVWKKKEKRNADIICNTADYTLKDKNLV